MRILLLLTYVVSHALALSMRGEPVDLSAVPRATTHRLTNGKRLLSTTKHMWIVESDVKPEGGVVAVGPGSWIAWSTEPTAKHALLEPRWKFSPTDVGSSDFVLWTRGDPPPLPGCSAMRVSRERLVWSCDRPLSGDELLEVAQFPELVSISARVPLANRDVESTRVLSGTADPEIFAGVNEIIAISDTGIDPRHCSLYASGTYPTYVVPATGPLVDLPPSTHGKIRAVARPQGIGDFTFGTGAHGQAVASVVLGNRCPGTSARPVVSGVCPDCSLLFFDIAVGNTDLYIPADLTRLFAVASSAGAVVHSASWGARACDGIYGDIAFQFDDGAYRYPKVTQIGAAGNCGPTGRISDPATFKSGISVGAGMSRAEAFVTYSISQRLARPELFAKTTVVSFSSIGPIRNGAPGPTLVAPGLGVYAAYALLSGTNGYNTMSFVAGTSFAAPAVAGLVAAFVSNWREDHDEPPDSSAVRAFLIASAEPTTRRVEPTGTTVKEISHVDGSYGVPSLLYYDDTTFLEGTFAEAGSKSWCFDAPFGGTVALAWIDPPVYPGSDDYIINDLDLFVSSESGTAKAEVRTKSTEAKLTLASGRQRVTVRLAELTGLPQKFHLAIVALGLEDLQECDSCLSTEPAAECVIANGVGVERCGWNGTVSCEVQRCDAGLVGPLCSVDVLVDEPCATIGGLAVMVNSTCLVSSCVAGTWSDGTACRCGLHKPCDDSSVVCETESCFASASEPAPAPAPASSEASVADSSVGCSLIVGAVAVAVLT